MTHPRTLFDSPWKEIVETYLPDFMAFFFPSAHPQIDWERGFEFLDSEFRQVVRDAELGKRFVDKLVKLYLIDGEETWILIHLYFQSQFVSNFAERIYVYNYRIYDRYRCKVASFIVLGDESPTWRPSEFGYELSQFEEEQQMPYITSVERLGIEKGKQQGEANLVLRLLNRRLGQVSESVSEQIRQLPIEQIEDLGEALLDFESEEDLLTWLAQSSLN